jgi:hypothetical protein
MPRPMRNAALQVVEPFVKMQSGDKKTIAVLTGEAIFCYLVTVSKVNQVLATAIVIASLVAALIFCKTSR